MGNKLPCAAMYFLGSLKPWSKHTKRREHLSKTCSCKSLNHKKLAWLYRDCEQMWPFPDHSSEHLMVQSRLVTIANSNPDLHICLHVLQIPLIIRLHLLLDNKELERWVQTFPVYPLLFKPFYQSRSSFSEFYSISCNKFPREHTYTLPY